MADQQDYDLHTLQEEAIRRAREMQARAQIPTRTPVYPAGGGQPRPSARPAEPPPAPVQEPRDDPPRARQPQPVEERREQKASPAPPLNSTANLFDALTKDGDRSLILVLILILMEDKTDMSLIFALMYLLL